MAECVMHAPVLDAARLNAGPHPTAALELVPSAAQFSFRGSVAASRAASQVFGPELMLQACRATRVGPRAALWLGPDQWLLLAPADCATAVQNSLAASLCDTPHALVSVSHRNTALLISGPDAATLLNAGCPLDLHGAAFPVDMCTGTVFAKASIILWRMAPHIFYVSVWRSYLPYVWDYLVEARTRL